MLVTKKDLTVKFYLGPWLDSCCKFHQGFQCFLRTRKRRCDHHLKKYCKKIHKGKWFTNGKTFRASEKHIHKIK